MGQGRHDVVAPTPRTPAILRRAIIVTAIPEAIGDPTEATSRIDGEVENPPTTTTGGGIHGTETV